MTVLREQVTQPGRPLVEIRNVARRFRLRTDKQRSLQDSFIHLFRRKQHNAGEFWPLKDISLTINSGDSVGIIGPNGSGKSTLLKLITGILIPSRGDLLVRGRISSLLELGAGFHPDLTGRENIYLNGSIYGLRRSEVDARIDQIIDYAELDRFIDTPLKHYSSGMYVRLGFAVAIHTDPDLLLVDEVLSVGDMRFQRKCLDSIRQFRNRGGTLLLVSHDLDSIQSICAQALWLDDGYIQAEGHPTDVIMAYTKFMAERDEQKRQMRANQLANPDGHSPEAVDTSSLARRWGTGAVRIVDVEFMDAQQQPRRTFHNGEPMTVCIRYEAAQPVDRPVFGLAFYHENGTHICGPNTRFDRLTIPAVRGAGCITYEIGELPFLPGSFVVSAAVVNEDDTETYDYHDRLYAFHVFQGKSQERYGLITLNGNWTASLAAPGDADRTPARVVERVI